jgi:hypothetical protein
MQVYTFHCGTGSSSLKEGAGSMHTATTKAIYIRQTDTTTSNIHWGFFSQGKEPVEILHAGY